MADIQTYINNILNAVYGEEVRASLVNALGKINADNEKYLTIKQEVVAAKDTVVDQVIAFDAKHNNALQTVIELLQVTSDAVTIQGNLLTVMNVADQKRGELDKTLNDAVSKIADVAKIQNELNTVIATAMQTKNSLDISNTGAAQTKDDLDVAIKTANLIADELKKTLTNIDTTAKEQLSAIQSAGADWIEKVTDAGSSQITAVQNAGTQAAADIDSAKTDAVTAVTEEGNIQTKRVQDAAAEIIADREQITALQQRKADAIVETASGEDIQAKDSAEAGFEGLRIFGKSIQDGIPAPESPVPIVSVGDKGTVEVEVTGKNIIDFDKYYGHLKSDDNDDKFTGMTRDFYDVKVPLPTMFIGKKLTFSALIYQSGVKANIRCAVKKGENIVDGNVSGDVDKWFLSKVSFVMMNKTDTIYFNYGSTSNVSIKNIQLEIGSEATTYEHYREPQTLTLQTPNGLPGVKVDSDGNYTDKDGQQWVCDEIDLERGKYVQRVAKYAFDGTESVSDTWFPTIITNMRAEGFTGGSKNKEILSNYERITFSNSTGRTFGFSATKWGISDGEELKTFLKNKYDSKNPVIAQYDMVTPVERDLTSEEIAAYKALHSNYPTTVISNDESAHMEVFYVADTKNYIAKTQEPLKKQITDLQNALISQKIVGGGIKVADSAKVPLVNFAVWGKTEQVQTTGANLFNEKEVVDGILQSDGSINKYDKTFITSGYIPVASGRKYTRTEKYSGNFYYDAEKNFVSKDAKGKNVSVPEGCHYLRVSYNKSDKNIMINEGEELKSYEPYSGGFPSPSPDWEQSIEVIDHPVTVTIKGGTEQQSVTLIPPRPLTKWDKLEKVDGVWVWVFKSGKAIFSGNKDEKWMAASTVSEMYKRFVSEYLIDKLMPCETNVVPDVFCTHYKSITANNMWGKLEEGISVQTDARVYVFDSKYKESSAEEFMQALAQNPIALYYETVATEYIPLTAEEQSKLNALTMYAPETEVSNNGGCQMELTYTVDTKAYVDSKIAEISKAII